MTLHDAMFYLLAILTAASAVAVVLTSNIGRAATWLFLTLSGTAGIFFLLGAEFLASMQLLISAGGIMVLLVLGVLLTARSPAMNLQISPAGWLIGLTVGLLLLGVLGLTALKLPTPRDTTAGDNTRPAPGQPGRSLLGSKHLGAALLGDSNTTPDGRLSGAEAVREQTRLKMSYLLPFELVSVYLLLVLIGAAYLTRARRIRRTVP